MALPTSVFLAAVLVLSTTAALGGPVRCTSPAFPEPDSCCPGVDPHGLVFAQECTSAGLNGAAQPTCCKPMQSAALLEQMDRYRPANDLQIALRLPAAPVVADGCLPADVFRHRLSYLERVPAHVVHVTLLTLRSMLTT